VAILSLDQNISARQSQLQGIVCTGFTRSNFKYLCRYSAQSLSRPAYTLPLSSEAKTIQSSLSGRYCLVDVGSMILKPGLTRRGCSWFDSFPSFGNRSDKRRREACLPQNTSVYAQQSTDHFSLGIKPIPWWAWWISSISHRVFFPATRLRSYQHHQQWLPHYVAIVLKDENPRQYSEASHRS